MLMLHPVATLELTPPLFGWGGANATLRELLPPHPTSMSEAFNLGVLFQQHATAVLAAATGTTTTMLNGSIPTTSSSSSSSNISQILEAAAVSAGRSNGPPLTASELSDVLAQILEIETNVGIVGKVTGFFTFVNIIWFLAIIGITVSIGPSLYHVLKPFRELLKRMATWLLEEVIQPIARRLHTWGVFESVAFVLCFLQVADGVRMSPPPGGTNDRTAGEFVALTGAALVLPTFAYTCMLWTLPLSTEWLMQLIQLWLGFCWIPLAICFESQLFGCVLSDASSWTIGLLDV
jgi:hypothetical protein